MFEIAIILAAAFGAGVLNAIAGGGSFLTFPALVLIGVPPISANATNSVAVFPGYISAAFGFRREIAAYDKRAFIMLMVLAALGGVTGALLLLVTPASLFRNIVPWLLLVATVLYAFDAPVRQWAGHAMGKGRAGSVRKTVATLVVTTYGGYFNGGLGIILLGLFSLLGLRDVNLMNGLKSALSSILTAASVITFSLAGIIYWQEAAIMMVATAAGGFSGANLSRRLPRRVVRLVVIGVGLFMTVAFWLR